MKSGYLKKGFGFSKIIALSKASTERTKRVWTPLFFGLVATPFVCCSLWHPQVPATVITSGLKSSTLLNALRNFFKFNHDSIRVVGHCPVADVWGGSKYCLVEKQTTICCSSTAFSSHFNCARVLCSLARELLTSATNRPHFSGSRLPPRRLNR